MSTEYALAWCCAPCNTRGRIDVDAEAIPEASRTLEGTKGAEICPGANLILQVWQMLFLKSSRSLESIPTARNEHNPIVD